MKKFSLDLHGIKKYQRNRYPYLMIDHVTEVIPGVSADGYKDLKDDWFFKVHWPEDPNMPGMLQIESLVQMAALTVLTLPKNEGKLVQLVSATDLVFKKKVVPGDILIIKTKLNSWKRGMGNCTGEGLVNDHLACKANFNIVMPDILRNIPKR